MPSPLLEEPPLAALRARVAQIEQAGRTAGAGVSPFGLEAVDARLAGGGLALGALHEIAPAAPEYGDDAAATLFVAALAARLSRESGGVTLWALTRRDLFAPGLAGAGLTPERVLYAECRDDAEALAVLEEGLRHGGLAAVVGEIGRLALAASRRLQLAAEGKGVTALLLRRWRKAGADPLGEASSAVTRWRIAAAPSAPLPYAGLGRARWRVELARQRGGPGFEWILEAPDAEARFALFAKSGDRPDQEGGEQRLAA